MKITAKITHVRDLKEGDFFSSAGQDYWDGVASGKSLKPDEFSLRLFMRTNAPMPEKIDPSNSMVYKLTFEK